MCFFLVFSFGWAYCNGLSWCGRSHKVQTSIYQQDTSFRRINFPCNNPWYRQTCVIHLTRKLCTALLPLPLPWPSKANHLKSHCRPFSLNASVLRLCCDCGVFERLTARRVSLQGRYKWTLFSVFPQENNPGDSVRHWLQASRNLREFGWAAWCPPN